VTYDTQTGKQLDLALSTPVLTDRVMYAAASNQLVAYDITQPKLVEKTDRAGKKIQSTTLQRLWNIPAEQITDVPEKNRKQWLAAHPLALDIKAGNRLYGHQGQTLFAVDLPREKEAAVVSWTHKIDGQVASMLAANGHLVVVTRDGKILTFGSTQRKPQVLQDQHTDLETADNVWRQPVQSILQQEKPGAAYCVALGIGSGNLILEILKQSTMRVIAIDADADRVGRFRQRCDQMGLLGSRVIALTGNPYRLALPPYLASLVVSESALPGSVADDSQQLATIYARLRPYGGSAWLPLSAAQHRGFVQSVAQAKLAQALVTREHSLSKLARQGALPGSADWTHEYGDASNTLMSLDQLVKAPLGVLWFGGPASDGSLFYNRHFWGPSMAVVNGRMFIQGPGKMTAVDVYTGRILWQIPLKDDTDYRPGRRGNDFEKHLSGFHFLAVEDAIYLVQGATCVKLDPTSGRRVAEFPVGQKGADWGRIRVKGDLLIGTVFQQIDADPQKVPVARRLLVGQKVPLKILALNRHTGAQVWSHEATSSFPVISVGTDRIYCFDGALESFYKDWKRRGLIPKASDRRKLVAIDLASGKVAWEKDAYIIGTWLAYSGGKDVVLLSNKENIVAFDGRTGDELWKQYSEGVGFRGHPESLWDRIIVWNDRILDQRGPGLAWNIRTGERMKRTHPITQNSVEWEFTKAGHHCNYAIANPHLMTFRAESAGFCDIESGNTARLNGFRSGCRNSLIPANGVLNAPNFAHGCVCGYSLFTSLALVHQPDSEVWSYSALSLKPEAGPVRRLGINLGAPGDRMSADGTLWLDYPNVGGSSPKASIQVQGASPSYFRRHSTLIQGNGLNWVAGSGVVGASSVTIDLGKSQPDSGSYTVRLHFCEPDDAKVDQRVFSVNVQDQLVVDKLDVVRESGGAHRSLIREIENVQVDKALKIDLIPHRGRPVLSGIEVVAESK
jgi:outer membrane protein assembly factor BamB